MSSQHQETYKLEQLRQYDNMQQYLHVKGNTQREELVRTGEFSGRRDEDFNKHTKTEQNLLVLNIQENQSSPGMGQAGLDQMTTGRTHGGNYFGRQNIRMGGAVEVEPRFDEQSYELQVENREFEMLNHPSGHEGESLISDDENFLSLPQRREDLRARRAAPPGSGQL